MWKIVVAFIVFAGLALFILSKGGDIDMSGEKHGDVTHTPAETAAVAQPASAPASAAVAPVASASAPAVSASK